MKEQAEVSALGVESKKQRTTRKSCDSSLHDWSRRLASLWEIEDASANHRRAQRAGCVTADGCQETAGPPEKSSSASSSSEQMRVRLLMPSLAARARPSLPPTLSFLCLTRLTYLHNILI